MEAAPATVVNSGNDSGVNGDDGGFTEEADRNSGGNRWPKQETSALIRIRSEMDAAFRDSNLKGPLWDEVSRKMLELGFNRSAKKCREKFENVYKYHRRTKDGRTLKSDKTYRFSDQLQALESSHRGAFGSPSPISVKPPPVLVPMPDSTSVLPPYSGAGPDTIQNNVSPISVAAPAVMAMPPLPVNHKRTFPFMQLNMSGSTNSGSSSETSNDEPPHKKRKWEGFFEKLMKELIAKQEELQVKFLDTLERRERDRAAKEEAWRAQELAKRNQEHDRLVKERSMVAAKDAAIVTFLQSLVGNNVDVIPIINDETRKKPTDVLQQVQQAQPPTPTPTPIQQPPPPSHRELPPPALPPPPPPQAVKNLDTSGPSPSSRWPKAEINALITLRTQLDNKYQENVPKGPLWEEISTAMRNLGYNRNAKRCKEKWENINKYYKKIKDNNKRRPEDSKTCPYFDQLDAIYREKSTPIIAQPENQWPPPSVKKDPQRPPATVGDLTQTPGQQPRVSDDHGSTEEYDEYTDDEEDNTNYNNNNNNKEDEHGVHESVGSKVSV
ncbi:trihelix transcription factor DF1-like [Bidens hawaiensis]|uniref:trihelix transcription factor DF1-like n=1 Tax=Bidens hawaiensis TaxID=980011 RepID=UPI00404A3F6D